MGLGSIRDVFDHFEDDGPGKRLVVLNRTESVPVRRALESALGEQVDVEERHRADAAEDTVLAVAGDEVIATSSLRSVMDAFLLVNSDRFRTGTAGLDEPPLPAVLSRMDEQVLELRGYPASNKEKLLLIAVSRLIERIALRADGGRLDAAFQRLSRLDDEFGTRRVYERLADSDVDVHVYGASGEEWIREAGPDVTSHTGDEPRYRRSWFVVYDPGPEAVGGTSDAGRPAALVAWETGPNVWRSAWTFDPAIVREIRTYLVEAF